MNTSKALDFSTRPNTSDRACDAEQEHLEYADLPRPSHLVFEQSRAHISFVTCLNCSTSIQLSFISGNQCPFCFSTIPRKLINKKKRELLNSGKSSLLKPPREISAVALKKLLGENLFCKKGG